MQEPFTRFFRVRSHCQNLSLTSTWLVLKDDVSVLETIHIGPVCHTHLRPRYTFRNSTKGQNYWLIW